MQTATPTDVNVHITSEEFEALVEAVAADAGDTFFSIDQTVAVVERIIAQRLGIEEN